MYESERVAELHRIIKEAMTHGIPIRGCPNALLLPNRKIEMDSPRPQDTERA